MTSTATTPTASTDVFEPLTPLAVGALTASLDAATGQLRYLCCEQMEIVRGVYVAVRDENWDTIAPQIADLSISEDDSAQHRLQISFHAICRRGEIDFEWDGQIVMTPNELTYRMDGVANANFKKNRIGFCVLHPIAQLRGAECKVTHEDGTMTDGVFPNAIAPHQPFQAIRSIRHAVNDKLAVEISFEGDVFEMEDQRNWTDASYKTYCTPLSEPFPVAIKAGERVSQSVSIRLLGDSRSSNATQPFHLDNAPCEVDLASPWRRFPDVGLCLTPNRGGDLTPSELRRISQLNLSHLRIDLDLVAPHWRERLQDAAKVAGKLQVTLDIAIHLSAEPETELRSLAEACDAIHPPVSHWLVFHKQEKVTLPRWIALARKHLGGRGGATVFVGGTNAYFAELNRSRPGQGDFDAVSFSINPQVHASDAHSLVETLEAQADAVNSAQQFCGVAPVHVGPVTLKPRFNPNATNPDSEADEPDSPSQVDIRQRHLFTAGWTLASIAQLAAAGASRLTYFETTGEKGVMEEDGLEGESPDGMGGDVVAGPAKVFPAYHTLAEIGDFAGQEFAPLTIRGDSRVWGLALRDATRQRLLLTNLSPRPAKVLFRGALRGEEDCYTSRTLDSATAELATNAPEEYRSAPRMSGPLQELTLEPIAVVSLDRVRSGGRA